MEHDGFTVTAHCRPLASIGHNLRFKNYIGNVNAMHIDESRSHLNKTYLNLGTMRECYDIIFGKAIQDYNAKQKRDDRKIVDYLKEVKEDARRGTHKNPTADGSRKVCYEMQFYLGNTVERCPDEIAIPILEHFATEYFPKHYPNFIPTHITLHNDEFSINKKDGTRRESPPHIHLIGVYVGHAISDSEKKIEEEFKTKKKKELMDEAEKKGIKWNEKTWTNWKKENLRKWRVKTFNKALGYGIETANSLSGACAEMSFYTEKNKGTAQQQFEEDVRTKLMDYAEAKGLKITRIKGEKHRHLTKKLYIKTKELQIEQEELEQREKIVNIKELSIENKLDEIDKKEMELQELQKKLELKTREILKKENELKEKEQAFEDKDKILKNKEKELNNKETKLLEKEIKVSADLKENTAILSENKKTLEEAIKIENKNQKEIEKINLWSLVSQQVDDSNDTIDKISENFKKSKNKEKEFPNFIRLIKSHVNTSLVKIKNVYEDKIKELKKKMLGYNTKDENGIKRHVNGSEEIKELFLNLSPNDLTEMATNMKTKNCTNIAELDKKEPSFLYKMINKFKQGKKEYLSNSGKSVEQIKGRQR